MSLAVVLAVLASCPETPTDTAAEIAEARKDVVSAGATPAAGQAAAIRDADMVSGELHGDSPLSN